MIVMEKLMKNNPKEDNAMQWHTQAGGITTNLKVKVDLTLPKLSTNKIVTWNFHVDGSAKGRCDMILYKDTLIYLGLN